MGKIILDEQSEPDTPAADKVVIYPKAGGGLYKKNDAGEEVQIDIAAGSTLPVADTTAIVKGSADATKLVRIEADGLTTDTTRVLTMPDKDITPAEAGANTDITSIFNAAFKAGRDADNNIDWGTDDTLIVTVGGVELFRGSATTLLLNDKILQRANFLDCCLITNAIGDFGGGAQAIDYESGSWVSATVSTSEFTFTFTNSVASDDFGIFGLALTNGGSQTGNWPTIHTAGGVAFPTPTTSGLDLFVFATYDGGTTHILIGYSLDVKAPA